MTKEQIADATVVVIGCGPVGLCALVNAEAYKPKNLLAVDSIESRLDLAKSLGGEPWNFQADRGGLDKRVKELTDGRGADAIIEVVGLSPALKMGFELMRPCGVISSVGVHNGEVSSAVIDWWTGLVKSANIPQIPWYLASPPQLDILQKLTAFRSGNEAYGKNVRCQMGRCPVRSIFPQALDMLQQKQHLLG